MHAAGSPAATSTANSPRRLPSDCDQAIDPARPLAAAAAAAAATAWCPVPARSPASSSSPVIAGTATNAAATSTPAPSTTGSRCSPRSADTRRNAFAVL
uniref:Uncharacterized protein n=1 Tax=Oryza rufipogon TaxID=4529 RepID=A0A0E0PCX0_ORYRU